MEKILITPRSFGKTDASVLELFGKEGYEPVLNPYGQIMDKKQMQEAVKGCVGVIIGVDPLDREIIDCAPGLRAIAKYGVGTDNIDLEYCRQKQIPVSITRNANTGAVADYAFTLLCACARNILTIHELCHEKKWSKVMGTDIHGKRLGILGFGAIGREMAKRAAGFEMEILAYDIFPDLEYAKQNQIRFTEPEEIFKTCDFISLHLPLTADTQNIVNAKTLSWMKPNAILINTARGGLIDEKALVEALKEHQIAGAGIDVFREEPPEDKELYHLKNLIMGSHCAASTDGASEKMSRMAAENLLRDLAKSV